MDYQEGGLGNSASSSSYDIDRGCTTIEPFSRFYWRAGVRNECGGGRGIMEESG